MTGDAFDTVREALLPPYSGGKVWEGVGPTPRMDALAALAEIERERDEYKRRVQEEAAETCIEIELRKKAEAERDELEEALREACEDLCESPEKYLALARRALGGESDE